MTRWTEEARGRGLESYSSLLDVHLLIIISLNQYQGDFEAVH